MSKLTKTKLRNLIDKWSQGILQDQDKEVFIEKKAHNVDQDMKDRVVALINKPPTVEAWKKYLESNPTLLNNYDERDSFVRQIFTQLNRLAAERGEQASTAGAAGKTYTYVANVTLFSPEGGAAADSSPEAALRHRFFSSYAETANAMETRILSSLGKQSPYAQDKYENAIKDLISFMANFLYKPYADKELERSSFDKVCEGRLKLMFNSSKLSLEVDRRIRQENYEQTQHYAYAFVKAGFDIFMECLEQDIRDQFGISPFKNPVSPYDPEKYQKGL